ncbi:hypothetical protein ACP70R_038423 [Stipagrostis hirtigluma subsp. patula]
MGNNNVTGQQVSEEPAHSVDKTTELSNSSPEQDNTNSEKNNEKDGTQDTDMSNFLNDSIVSNAGDEQVVSDQNESSSDEENRGSMGSIEDNTSTKDHELVKHESTETTICHTETTTDDSLISSDKAKQLVHGTRDMSGEGTVGKSSSLVEENIEGSLEDEAEPRGHEDTPMGGNLSSEDTNERSQEGQIEVSAVEDQLMAIKGQITSSTESFVTTYLDADDSEIKEVVIEDKPRQQVSPSYVQLLDATNIETSKNYITEIPQQKEEISAISKTTTVELMSVNDGVLIEEDKYIHGYEDIPEYSARDSLYNGEVVAQFQPCLRNSRAIYEQKPENYELNERVVASRKTLDSVAATVKHSSIESTNMKEGTVDNNFEVQNLADNFEWEKEPDEYDGNLVGPVQANGEDVTCLHSSSSYHLFTVNEENEQREVNGVNGILVCDKGTAKEISERGHKANNAEGLGQQIDAQITAKEGGDLSNLPMITLSTPLPLLEDFDKKGCIELDSSDSTEGTTNTAYDTGTRDTQEIITSSQGDLSQQILLEEHEVMKLESSETLGTCMQLVEDTSKIGKIFTDDSINEKVDGNATASSFNSESNRKGVTSTTTVGFAAEHDQGEVPAGVDSARKEQFPLQISTPVREASEETPPLKRVESISSFSHSTEQHSKISVDIPMSAISVMQFKAEGEEESEKSPLLSPREPSGDFRLPNHSARKKKPFQILVAEDSVGMLSPLKEQESTPIKNVSVSSPRSKGKQKTRSSLFTSCMCCATHTN